MTPFKPNVTKSIDNLNILNRDLHLVYGDELETNIDNMLINNVDNKTGSSLTYNNTVDSGKLDFDIIGNIEQEGTPTPEDEIPVKTVTETNQIVIETKNKLPYSDKTTDTYNGITINNTKGKFEISGSATDVAGMNFILQEDYTIKNGDYLHLGNDKSNASLILTLYEENGTAITPTFSLSPINRIENLSAYVGKTIHYLRFYFNSQFKPTSPITAGIMILNNVTTATEFVQYKSQTYTLHLNSLELCKIGNYSDKIVKTATGWNVIKNIGKVVLNGSETWYGNYPRYHIFMDIPIGTYITISNYFLGVNSWSIHTSTNNSVILYRDSNWNEARLSFNSDEFADIDAFKNWLISHNVKVYYQLATPVETHITDTTLIADLDALYNDAVTYDGQTNITTIPDTDNAQMLLDVSVFVTEKEV